MTEIIEAADPFQTKLDQTSQIKFWQKVIEAFQDEDCDTLSECLDKDVPSAYKVAYYKLDPWQHGYRTGCGFETDSNPWDEKTHPVQFEKWADGYDEGILE